MYEVLYGVRIELLSSNQLGFQRSIRRYSRGPILGKKFAIYWRTKDGSTKSCRPLRLTLLSGHNVNPTLSEFKPVIAHFFDQTEAPDCRDYPSSIPIGLVEPNLFQRRDFHQGSESPSLVQRLDFPYCCTQSNAWIVWASVPGFLGCLGSSP